MAYETLEILNEGSILWLTLNRPQSLNALSGKMVDELEHFFGSLRDDRKTRVVIMRGAGRAFCAGLDLKEQNRGGGDSLGSSTTNTVEGQRRMSDLVVSMRRAPQPFIAAIKGPASGGGFALALACDCRIAGESARMNAAFIRIGLSACDMGVSYFLPRAVGSSVAYELLLTGRFINAQRALATGLVSELVPDSELDAAAGKLARDMIETSPLGLRLTKECLSASIDAPGLEAAAAMEDRNQVLCVRAGYLEEGARAFVEKRKAHFAERA
ncbi:MAG TPA: enoyl-CoA hydratase/isomerase family protein [Candidatus Binataceae bacterium]|nr:enoyl-CoA hydratase/isomerase family protein [Candidatus Binataceae bacterium]